MKKKITQFFADWCRRSFLMFFMLCSTIMGYAQNSTVSGKITDEKGKPLVGVNIMVKGIKAGAVSNPEGNFSINVSNENAVLVFTFLGMKPREIALNGRKTIDVTLEEDANSLDGVVVVGYGTQLRRDITGSISSIKEKTLREVPVANVSQMIEGRIPGAYVTTGANKPGTTPSIRIRGNRSFSAGNDPLYVVDGIPVNDAITDFNPSDVVSIEVLKDASATAIYGSRGANGVILVTTARGKAGQTDVRYNAYYGITDVVRRADIFNGEEFVKFVRDSYAALTPPVTDELVLFKDAIERESVTLGRYTDWQDLIIKKGHTQNHELGISSGTEKTKINLSLGYFDDVGYLIGQNYRRYTARINVDQNLGKRIKLGMSLLGSYSEIDGANYNPYAGALISSPLGQPYDSDGKFMVYPINDPAMPNPLLATQKDKFINLEKRTRVLGSFFAEAEIISGLKYRVNFGPDLRNTRGGSFNSTSVSVGVSPTASTSEGYWFSYALDNQLTYDKVFNNKHKLNVTALYGIQQRVNESSNISVRDLPVETTTYHNLGSAGTIVGVGSGYTRWNILSYMGRINYAFDGRYSITLTGRADGSSRFAPGNKWSFFPSAGFAYNISEEKFLKDVPYLSNLKLRLGYGSVGQEAVTPYQTLAQLVRTPYDFDGVSAFGFAPSNVPNKDLKWETSTTANVAVDFGFFNQRISGSIDVYQTKTTDLLLPAPLPTSTGFGSVTTNIGSTRNRGIDISLSTQNIVSKSGFQWSTDITAGINKGEIIELALGKVDDVGAGRFIGKPLNVYYDYEKIGIWQTGEQAQATLFGSKVGQIRVKDQDGDGKVSINDRVIIGSPDPRFTFGFNNNFSFKGFDLAVFVIGVQGKTISSPLYDGQNTVAFGGRYNHLKVDYWTPSNPTNAYPQPIAGQGPASVLYRGTMKYFDGSFVRIRNINLGYTLPKMTVSKIGAKSLRVYFNVTNPFVFSSYVRNHNGIDPEILDNPATINYQLGLNVNF